MTHLSLESTSDIFLDITKAEKRILHYIFRLHMQYNGNVYASLEKIALRAQCDRSTVVRFFKKCKDKGSPYSLILTIKKGNRKKSNRYFIDPQFLLLLKFLDKYNLFYKSRPKIRDLVGGGTPDSFVNENAPQFLPKCTYSLLLSHKEVPLNEEVPIFKEKIVGKKGFIHECLKPLDIPYWDKRLMSKCSEKILREAINDYNFYRKTNTVDNRTAFILGMIREYEGYGNQRRKRERRAF